MNHQENIEKPVKEAGKNKKIPQVYEKEILEALSHFPELRETPVQFLLKRNFSVPYSVSPVFSDLFKPGPVRWNVSILEKAEEPVKQVLFKNLSHECRLGILGHLLGHVLHYSGCSKGELIRIFFLYTGITKKRELERGADISAINHGLGQELYSYAVYIRSIREYISKRKDIDIYHLKPNEILQGFTEKEVGQGI